MDAAPDRGKAEALAEAEARARASLASADPAKAESAAGFVPRFWRRVAASEVMGRDAATLAGAALSLYRFAERRSDPRPAVRVSNPRLAETGWQCPHTVVEIVNDDMPFLVRSEEHTSELQSP